MKAHSLIRIKSSLVNTPHLIEENSFNTIMDYVNSRIQGNAEIMTPQKDMAADYSQLYVPESKTGVMHISGPLTYRTSGWEALCGGTSYEMLKEQMEYFVASGAKTVAWMVDSGGGEAHGMMDSANYLRKLADDNGIKIVAYVDGMSASAAYGLSSVAHEIVASGDSLVGSIGVLIQLMNNSKQLANAGIERTFITAGKDKVPFAKDGSFTPEFIDGLQEQVDTLYEAFTSHVAEARGISLESVKGTEANVFMTDEALKLGLIDKVMTVEDFYDYLATEAQSNLEGNDMGIKDAIKLNFKGDKAEMAKLEEMQTLLTAAQEGQAAAIAEHESTLAKLTSLTDQLGEMTTQLEKFKEMQAAAEAAAAEAKLEARKTSMAAVMNVDEVTSKLAAYAALDDATFAFMIGELQSAKDAKAESFKPVGQDNVEEDESSSELSTEEDKLRAGLAAAAKARYAK